MRLFITAILFFSSYWAVAQEKIETDRPDQTESPYTVPKKYFQAELGFNKENLNDGYYNLIHPTALLKYGLSNKVELRFASILKTEYAAYALSKNTSSVLLEPIALGAKIGLIEEKDRMPKVSVIGEIRVPFLASKTMKPDALPYLLRLTMQNSISKNIGLGYNIGFEKDGFENKNFWFYTLAPGFQLGKRWYTYIEVFGSVAQNELPDHALDGGVAYFVNDDIKIDFSAGFGLSENSFKNYLAIGCSFRFPLIK